MFRVISFALIILFGLALLASAKAHLALAAASYLAIGLFIYMMGRRSGENMRPLMAVYWYPRLFVNVIRGDK